jgi:hypothetical protein
MSKIEEKLDDANLERVIGLLEPAEGVKPITKKLACELLNIAYNTTRLGTILTKYKDKKAHEKAKRAANRGKPASDEDVKYVIKEYINGEPVSKVADSLFRSPGFVLRILEEYNVPIRSAGHDYFKPILIPEEAMRSAFTVGEVVYSARYDSTARIEGTFPGKDGSISYRIWLLREKWLQSAYQPAEELASLEHLTKLGIKF